MILFQTGTGTNYVSKMLPACLSGRSEGNAQEKWSCMAFQEKWEMLWSPTRLSFLKVASDMRNLLIKRPAKYWKGFYLLLPSSSLKIRPASEAEVVHPQSLGNFDHLGLKVVSAFLTDNEDSEGRAISRLLLQNVIWILIQAEFKTDAVINEKLRETACWAPRNVFHRGTLV